MAKHNPKEKAMLNLISARIEWAQLMKDIGKILFTN